MGGGVLLSYHAYTAYRLARAQRAGRLAKQARHCTAAELQAAVRYFGAWGYDTGELAEALAAKQGDVAILETALCYHSQQKETEMTTKIVSEYGDPSGSTLIYEDSTGKHQLDVLTSDSGGFLYDLDGRRIRSYELPDDDTVSTWVEKAESSYNDLGNA